MSSIPSAIKKTSRRRFAKSVAVSLTTAPLAGVQFVGAAWSEYLLLAVAEKHQQATDWHTKRPSI